MSLVRNDATCEQCLRDGTCLACATLNDLKEQITTRLFQTACYATPVQIRCADDYVRDEPTCPGGGTYALNDVQSKPTCSISGHTL